MLIRQYQESDARALADIYYYTIHNINIRDYAKEQVNAWAPESCLELDGWKKKWEKISPLVAIIDDQVESGRIVGFAESERIVGFAESERIVGFAEFEDNGHIDCFYVHHQFQGKGVGSSLIKEIEKQAKQKNISKIFAEVSITAKPFFLSKGFKIVKEQLKEIRGVKLKNFVMEKILEDQVYTKL